MNKEIANNSTIHLLIDKIIFFQDVVQRTILNCQKNKLLEKIKDIKIKTNYNRFY